MKLIISFLKALFCDKYKYEHEWAEKRAGVKNELHI